MTTTNLGSLNDRTSLNGTINNANPVDLIQFIVGAGSSVNAGLIGLNANLELRLFKAGSTFPIAESKNSGTQSESINVGNLLAGEYFLQVNRVGTIASSYILNLSNAIDACDVIAGIQDLGTVTTAVSTVFGTINDQNTVDQYRVHLDSPGNLNAVLRNTTGDLTLTLFRESDNTSGFIDHIIDSFQARSLNEAELLAGDYILKVEQYGGSVTPYILMFSTAKPSNLLIVKQDLGVLGSAVISADGLVNTQHASEFFQFKLNHPSPINIALVDISNTANNADLDLRLVKNNGDGIITDDQVIAVSRLSGSMPDAINLARLGVGTYQIQVSQYRGGSLYTLRLSTSNPSNLIAEQENLGTLGTATVSRQGAIGFDNMSDIYRFDLAADSPLNIVVQNTGTNNLDLRLFKDNGSGVIDPSNVLAISSNPSTFSDAINLQSLSKGTYYVQVFGKQVLETQDYKLNLSTNAISNLIADEQYLTLLGSTVVTCTGHIDENNTSDMYRFFTKGGAINIALTGLGDDLDLRLLKDDGNFVVEGSEVVWQSGASGRTPDSINWNNLPLGFYFIQVVQAKQAASDYVLRVSQSTPSNLIAEEVDLGVLHKNSLQHDGVVNDLDTADIYRFSVSTPLMARFQLTGLSQDADVDVIFDRSGNGIIEPEDVLAIGGHGGNTSEEFFQQLDAGSYFVRVRQYQNSATHYWLTIADTSILGVPFP